MWVVLVNVKFQLTLQLLPEPWPTLLKLHNFCKLSETSRFFHQLMAFHCDFHVIFRGFVEFTLLVLWPMGWVWRCHFCQAARFAGASFRASDWQTFWIWLSSDSKDLLETFLARIESRGEVRDCSGHSCLFSRAARKEARGFVWGSSGRRFIWNGSTKKYIVTWSTVGVLGNRPSYPTSSVFLVDAVQRYTNLHPLYAKSQWLLCRFFALVSFQANTPMRQTLRCGSQTNLSGQVVLSLNFLPPRDESARRKLYFEVERNTPKLR